MKFTKKTTDVLANFVLINPQILFTPGNKIRTRSKSDDLFAIADTDIEFTEEVGIHDLKRLLSVMSLFVDPEVIMTDNLIRIETQRQKIGYRTTPKEMIEAYLDFDIEFEGVLTFDLAATDLKNTMKAAHTLGQTEIAFRGDGQHIYIEGLNVNNPSDNTLSIQIGETDKTFNVVCSKDRFLILERDYKVTIAANGGIEFKTDGLIYYLACKVQNTNLGDIES